MRNKRNPMMMVVNINRIGLEEAESNWVEVKEILNGKKFLGYRGEVRRKELNAKANVQMRIIYMFGSYFNGRTELGKRNPGLYEKLLVDEKAVAGLI